MPEAFTSAFNFAWTQFGNGIDLITEKPILLIGFAFGVIGCALAHAKGLLRFGKRG